MSTIRVNNLQNTSTTDGGISIDTSGHVTVDGVAMPSAGPLSNRNLIINGAMQVAQRGTSSTLDQYQTVDRFRVTWGGVNITQSQQTLSSGDPYNEGFRYFLRAANTSTSSATNSFSQLDYYTESQDIAKSGWNYTDSNSFVTVSFWARSSLAGTYYVHCADEDVNQFVYNIPFTLSANTWTKITHSIPGNSSLVFNNDNGRGLRLSFIPYYGTDFTNPTNSQEEAWFTRDEGSYTPDYSQNWNNTASATFDITGVQLEVGSVATPFEHRSYGDELARCQRYYFQTGTGATYNSVTTGFANTTTNSVQLITYPVQMRSAPSLTDVGNWEVIDATSHNTSAISSLNSASNTSGAFNCTTTGLTVGRGNILRNSNDATATLQVSAEL